MPFNSRPCSWGCRLVVPLEGDGWTATVDDVRELVSNLHSRMTANEAACMQSDDEPPPNIGEPPNDYFMHVLGTGKLKGRLPRQMAHLRQKSVVVLGAYKIRQPHIDALMSIRTDCPGIQSTLARFAAEIESQHKLGQCVDVLSPEVRGGHFCWSGAGCDDHSALVQEFRAWVHLGASPHDMFGQEQHEEWQILRKQI